MALFQTQPAGLGRFFRPAALSVACVEQLHSTPSALQDKKSGSSSDENETSTDPNKMRYFLLLFSLMILSVNIASHEVDYVIVYKSEKKMYLLSEGDRIKEYNVVFGANPKGHKQHEGDERTPEGKYILDYKKSDSSFYKAIHISYPNEADRRQARENGVSPGGQIMIHGQKNGQGSLSWLAQQFNWTDGCIAVTNAEMDEIWTLVKLGTPIEILP